MSWDKRELTSLTLNNNGTLSFSYNSSGLRTHKTYTHGDSVTVHDYTLDGTTIMSETVSANGVEEYTLYYLYEGSAIIGFIYNNAYYYFQKNLQGDIVRILNAGGEVVTEYTYDAWGNVLSVTGSLATSIGQINPFRYRGYYYDTETKFYYLQSRYYAPSVGRFINADGIVGANGGVVGYNMFAYCNNNPVMCYDPTGAAAFIAAPKCDDDIMKAIQKASLGTTTDIYCGVSQGGGYTIHTFNSYFTYKTKGFWIFKSKVSCYTVVQYCFEKVNKKEFLTKYNFYRRFLVVINWAANVANSFSSMGTTNDLRCDLVQTIIGIGGVFFTPILTSWEHRVDYYNTEEEYVLHHAIVTYYEDGIKIKTEVLYP